MNQVVKHVLRGTHGRHAGSVFVIDRPLMLGRAPDADVQILDSGVSRQHARIKFDQGHVVVLDLASSLGTRVGGQRVDRKELRPGETLEIGAARFVYETRPAPAMTSPSFADKVRSAETLHRTRPGIEGTQPHPAGEATGSPEPRTPSPPLREPPPRAFVRQPSAPSAPREHAPSFAPAPRGPLSWSDAPSDPSGPGVPTLESDDGGSELAALFRGVQPLPDSSADPSGRFSLRPDPPPERPPPGGPSLDEGRLRQLLERLVHYHELASRATRQALDARAQTELQWLENEFQTSDASDKRHWKRFSIEGTGSAVWFRNLQSKTVAIHLHDLSAAGLRFSTREIVFAAGDVVSIVLGYPSDGRRQAVFSSRVAWVDASGGTCGVMFVGPASWQPR